MQLLLRQFFIQYKKTTDRPAMQNLYLTFCLMAVTNERRDGL